MTRTNSIHSIALGSREYSSHGYYHATLLDCRRLYRHTYNTPAHKATSFGKRSAQASSPVSVNMRLLGGLLLGACFCLVQLTQATEYGVGFGLNIEYGYVIDTTINTIV